MTEYALTEDAIEDIQSEFIENYDTDYWNYTLTANYAIWKEADEFLDLMGTVPEDLDRDSFIEDIERYATSELVYSFYHTAEALFAMMMASQTDVPWLVLREYRHNHLWNFARTIVNEDETDADTIGSIFYQNLTPDEKLNTSCREIHEYLQGMFQTFEDNEVYNSYKHGLRLMTDEEFAQFYNDESDEPIAELGGYAHIYLKDKDIEDSEMSRLIRVVRAYDAEFHYQMASVNIQLIEAILDALKRQSKSEDDEDYEVRIFEDDTISNAPYDRSSSYMELEKPYDVGEYTIRVN